MTECDDGISWVTHRSIESGGATDNRLRAEQDTASEIVWWPCLDFGHTWLHARSMSTMARKRNVPDALQAMHERLVDRRPGAGE
jgi:hypothetical protein